MFFYGSGAGPWTPFAIFLQKARKRYKKGQKKGAGMDAFSMECRVFPENGKVHFECAGASGLRFRPLLLLLCASIFAPPFLHRFFDAFWPPWVPGVYSSAAEVGPPEMSLIEAHSESSLCNRARSAPGLLPTA